MNWNDIYCFLMDCEISLLDIKKAYKSLEDKLIKFENRINNSCKKTEHQREFVKTVHCEIRDLYEALSTFNRQIRENQDYSNSKYLEED